MDLYLAKVNPTRLEGLQFRKALALLRELIQDDTRIKRFYCDAEVCVESTVDLNRTKDAGPDSCAVADLALSSTACTCFCCCLLPAVDSACG